jgi:hypothetical protein
MAPARRRFYANFVQRLDARYFFLDDYDAVVRADGHELAFPALRQLDMLGRSRPPPGEERCAVGLANTSPDYILKLYFLITCS